MAFTEFYCNSATGSNLNGGSDAGSPSMTDTAGTGSWVSTTQVYTSVSTSGTVAVGQFLAIYTGSPSIPSTVARIISVSGGSGAAWIITVSDTAYSGTQPSTLTSGSTYKANVGGAWAGPTGGVSFPFNFIGNRLTDASANVPRVNLKNGTNYAITSGMTNSVASTPVYFQGYTTTVGDGGKAIIDGGTSGASFTLLTTTKRIILEDLIFQNNGATGSASGIIFQDVVSAIRVVVNNVVGNGFDDQGGSLFIECEAYTCNQSNTASKGGFAVPVGIVGSTLVRCISHDNAGSNSRGFFAGDADTTIYQDCIADSNGSHGLELQSSANPCVIRRCIFYNNTGSGLYLNTNNATNIIEDCIFEANHVYGIQGPTGGSDTSKVTNWINNCAFFNNSTAPTTLLNASLVIGSITLSGSAFTDAANGDFSLNNNASAGIFCRNAGRGNFTQISGDGYTKTTIAYPDVGAAQHHSGIIKASSMSGGLL